MVQSVIKIKLLMNKSEKESIISFSEILTDRNAMALLTTRLIRLSFAYSAEKRIDHPKHNSQGSDMQALLQVSAENESSSMVIGKILEEKVKTPTHTRIKKNG